MVKPYSSNELAKLLAELELCSLAENQSRWSKKSVSIINQVIALRGPGFTADVIGCSRSRIIRLIYTGVLVGVPDDPEFRSQMKV